MPFESSGHLAFQIDRMAVFPRTLRAVAGEIAAEDARWKPADGGWSVLEIVWHLADEERVDFAVRLRSTIETPLAGWPPIDPEGLATERRYNELDMGEALDRFECDRAEHIEWLRTLTMSDLLKEHDHPRMGAVPASVMLASWSAHDALHLRQISKRLYQLVQRDAPGTDLRYAGEW